MLFWALAILLGGCGLQYGSGDYTIMLPGGYKLVRANDVDVVIGRANGDVVITQTINGYAVVESLIVGHVTAPQEADRWEYRDLPSGFFVLDTSKGGGEPLQGLDKQRWLEVLRSKGVASEPMLQRPSRPSNYIASPPATAGVKPPEATDAPGGAAVGEGEVPPGPSSRENAARQFRLVIEEVVPAGSTWKKSLQSAARGLEEQLDTSKSEGGSSRQRGSAQVMECVAILSQMKAQGELSDEEHRRLSAALDRVKAVLESRR